MSLADHYSVLGVLPDAEEIVISAAFKALAQRYHPDKWEGDSAEAHRRMSEINAAYRVLGDSTLRAHYDQSRNAERDHNQDFRAASREAYNEAFNDALVELEDRWSVAASIFPDLVAQRSVLARISTSLAFSFVAGLLATKQFEHRAMIAAHLEQTFLERFFGSNERVLKYARGLILDGNRPAALALNRLVDVMGSEVDPELLIRKVDEDLGVRKKREQATRSSASRAELIALTEAVRGNGYYAEAQKLARLNGHHAMEVGGGLLRSPTISVTSPTGAVTSFPNEIAFVKWVQDQLCE